MGCLAHGKNFENMLQLKCFGLYFERILDSKWLLSYRNNDISYRDARGFGCILPEKNLKCLVRSGAFGCIILIRFSLKKYHYLL